MNQLMPPTGVATVRVRAALIAALAAVGFAAILAAASAPPAAAATTGVVNVNTASALELERLPGIGESKAKAIVAYRKDNGAYQQVEDLLEVKGIGDGALERIRKLVDAVDSERSAILGPVLGDLRPGSARIWLRSGDGAAVDVSGQRRER